MFDAKFLFFLLLLFHSDIFLPRHSSPSDDKNKKLVNSRLLFFFRLHHIRPDLTSTRSKTYYSPSIGMSVWTYVRSHTTTLSIGPSNRALKRGKVVFFFLFLSFPPYASQSYPRIYICVCECVCVWYNWLKRTHWRWLHNMQQQQQHPNGGTRLVG